MPVQTTARLRYVSIPPRKMRLVANLIKGLPVEKALDILNFTPRIAAVHIAKTIKSAAANALSLQGTGHLRPEALHVKTITVDAAPVAKRVEYRSMGRVYRIRKRHCHLTVVLEEMVEKHRVQDVSHKGKVTPKDEEPQKKTTRKKVATKKKTARKKTAVRKTTARKTTAKKTTKKRTASTAQKDKGK